MAFFSPLAILSVPLSDAGAKVVSEDRNPSSFDEEVAANDPKEGSAGAGESLELAAGDAKAWSLEST